MFLEEKSYKENSQNKFFICLTNPINQFTLPSNTNNIHNIDTLKDKDIVRDIS